MVGDYAYEGALTHLTCHTADGGSLMALLPNNESMPPAAGAAMTLGFAAKDALVLASDAA